MKKKKFVLLNISGIKCDNPNCDYRNNEVRFEDYAKWIDKPCPKCGQNLLTQQDYNFCLNMMKQVDVINNVIEDKIQDGALYEK